MSSSAAILVAVLIQLGQFGVIGHAAAAEAPVCAENPQCRSLQEQGIKEHNQKRYAEALRVYEQAFQLIADPRLQVLMGRSRFRLGEFDEALKLYLQARPNVANSVERAQLDRFIAEATASRPQTATPTPTPTPTPNLTATATPTPAVKLTTEPVADAPKPIYKKWWFWTIIGVAAAGAATGIGLGLASRGPDTSGVPEYRFNQTTP